MARPSKFSDDFIDVFKERMQEWLDDGGLASNAYLGLGISKDTYYRWQKDLPEFKELCDEYSERALNLYEKTLVAKATGAAGSKGVDTTALLALLNNKTKGEYRQQNADSGNTVNIGTLNVLETLPNTELLAKIKQNLSKYHLTLDEKQQELLESGE